jgi:polysaccharide export outer membrane protein
MKQFCLAFLLLLSSSVIWAQQVNPIILPGDLLHLQVFDTPNMEETARVGDDGYFPLLIGGRVKISSLTFEQASQVIEQRLIDQQIMYRPHVLLTSVEHDAQNVTVFGQVVRPGPFTLDSPRSVLDAIAASGGLTDVADRNITIHRRGSGIGVSYYIPNEGDAASATAPLVYPGDRVIVARAPVSYVLGDVAKPGGYLTIGNDNRMTVLQAVAQAGGTTPSAVPNHSTLIRRTADGKYSVIRLRISDMAKGKKPDVEMQANDILYIPFSYLRNALSSGVSGLVTEAAAAAIYTTH